MNLRSPSVYRALMFAITLIGWGTLLLQTGTATDSYVAPLVIMLLVAGAWANYLKIEFGPVSVNQAFAFDLLAVLMLDPIRAAWIGALSYLAGNGIPGRHNLERNLANSAIIGFSVYCMGLTYRTLGGYGVFVDLPNGHFIHLGIILTASLAHLAVNSGLVYSIVLSRPTPPPMKAILLTVKWDLLAKFLFAPLAYYIYLAYNPTDRVGLVAPMLFILGIWLLLKNTMELNQAKTQLGKSVATLKNLHEFSKEVYASLDMPVVLDTALKRCLPLAGSQHGAIFFLDPITKTNYIGHQLSPDPTWEEYLQSPEMNTLVAVLAQTESPLPGTTRTLPGGIYLQRVTVPEAASLGSGHVLAIRLYDGTQVAGVLVLALPGDKEPPDTALQTLAIICMEVTQAIGNARLHAEVKREMEKRQEELALAEKIQLGALPKSHESPGVKVSTYFRPARSVGGDYFDLIHIKESNCLAIVIGDVSGKGIPAALTMMSVINRVKVWTNHFRSPDRVLEMLNESLVKPHRSFDEVLQYSTAVFGLLDLRTRKFTFSMAGHERPLLLSPGSNIAVPLEGEGYPLGLFAESTYTAKSVQLNTGDRLIFFTDGITDMQNSAGERLTREGFLQRILKVHERQPEDFPRELIHSLQCFSGVRENLADDQALMILEVTDAPAEPEMPSMQFPEQSAGGFQPAVF